MNNNYSKFWIINDLPVCLLFTVSLCNNKPKNLFVGFTIEYYYFSMEYFKAKSD